MEKESRPALALLRDDRIVVLVEAALKKLKVAFEHFVEYPRFVRRARTVAVETRAQLLIVDYALLPERLETVMQLALSSPGAPILVVAPTISAELAGRAVRAGALDAVCSSLLIARLESAIFPERLEHPRLRVPTLDELVREHVLWVLERNGGNIARSARELGMDRRTLQRKLPSLSN
jgi:ActR/RegA family two-component response regulator